MQNSNLNRRVWNSKFARIYYIAILLSMRDQLQIFSRLYIFKTEGI